MNIPVDNILNEEELIKQGYKKRKAVVSWASTNNESGEYEYYYLEPPDNSFTIYTPGIGL